MKLRSLVPFSFLVALLVGLAAAARPAPVAAQGAVANGILFYSSASPHCHIVMNVGLPPLQDQYQDRLYIKNIDVTQAERQGLYQAAVSRFKITSERLGVPTLILGSAVLVSSAEIPALIEQGLAAGGVAWPEFDGLKEVLGIIDPQAGGPSPFDMVARDPVANTIAIVVLIGMIVSLIAVGYQYLQDPVDLKDRWPSWVLPALCIIGLGVASYLTYVEVTKTEAFCGPIGNCNAVQSSPYSRIFGILPVGIFGAIGYLAILAAWLVQRYGPQNLRRLAVLSLWGFTIFGVLFSAYLTFLEPFVIGATCAWCITNAIIITILMWVATPAARLAMADQEDELLAEEEAV